MVKHTLRDKVWNAALMYAKEWEDSDVAELEHRDGFRPPELANAKDLEASDKTVRDTLYTMAEMGWLTKHPGRGGNHTEFSR